MPELSRFFGIIIRMFAEAGDPHHRPHFHAYHQDSVAVFAVNPVDLIAGTLPVKQRRLVEAWAELHQAELEADWALLQRGRRPLPIEPLRWGGRMSHPLHRVTSFDRLGGTRLRVSFEDGTSQVIDFSPVLFGDMFGPLRDPALFDQVRLDPEVHTLVWPTGADFDPATLHDWPDHAQALAAMARRWDLGAA